jgi:glucose-1-phosphate thymidylyltransferase
VKVIILAAGYAVRLKSLTLNKSKALLEVGGRKILDRILDKVAALKDAVEEVYIVTNAKFFEAFEKYRGSLKAPFKVRLINDGTTTNESRLGAIRDMALAISRAGRTEDLLVIAGDNLFEFKLLDFIEFAKARPGKVAAALCDINDIEAAKKFGVAALDKDARIVSFEEKPEKPKSTLISTGIYYFPKEKIGLIDDYVKSGDSLDAPGHYIKRLSASREVCGFVFEEYWCDIGDMKSYEEANRRYSQ